MRGPGRIPGDIIPVLVEMPGRIHIQLGTGSIIQTTGASSGRVVVLRAPTATTTTTTTTATGLGMGMDLGMPSHRMDLDFPPATKSAFTTFPPGTPVVVVADLLPTSLVVWEVARCRATTIMGMRPMCLGMVVVLTTIATGVRMTLGMLRMVVWSMGVRYTHRQRMRWVRRIHTGIGIRILGVPPASLLRSRLMSLDIPTVMEEDPIQVSERWHLLLPARWTGLRDSRTIYWACGLSSRGRRRRC
jgi:hypothetical protein